MSDKSHVHGERESHSGIVPTKRWNEGRGGPKEIAEGRPLTKENAEEPNPYRTPSRESGPSGLDRVRQAAKGDPKMRFTALLHHVDIDLLRSSYHNRGTLCVKTSKVRTVCVRSARTDLCGGCRADRHPYRDPTLARLDLLRLSLDNAQIGQDLRRGFVHG